MNTITFKNVPRCSTLKYLFLILVFINFSCKKDSVEITKAPTTPEVPVDKAPQFTLNSLAGSQVSLSAHENKVVVLFFFGNNCPTCKSAGSEIESKLSAPYETNSKYAILGIDQWNGNTAAVQSFKTASGIKFPLLLNGAETAAAYKTTYDRLIVLNKAGEVAFKGTQNAGNDVSTVKSKVTELLAD